MIYVAQTILSDSWLKQYPWFIDGYDYALTQNRAIPAMSSIEPESLFFAVSAIIRGAYNEGHTIETILENKKGIPWHGGV